MNTIKSPIVNTTLNRLHAEASKDDMTILLSLENSSSRPMKPSDFQHAYLPISQSQGHSIRELIIQNNCKSVVEFGTSFGISTIYLAEAVSHTGGKVITTEILESKAKIALQNIKDAGLEEYVEIRVGDAMQSLSADKSTIDFLFLDGWKDLYLPLFVMLESRLHNDSLIYADNMDMYETRDYAEYVKQNYATTPLFNGKAFLSRNRI